MIVFGIYEDFGESAGYLHAAWPVRRPGRYVSGKAFDQVS
jgi:hypothetical protein